MISQVHIRDIPAIESLVVQTVRGSVQASDAEKHAFLNNVARNIAWWCSHEEQGVHLLSLQGERIAGVVMVKDYWNLCSLFVHPDFQRRGIGRALLQTAVERCREHGHHPAVRLNAAANAVAFYQACGFIVTAPPSAATLGATPMSFALERKNALLGAASPARMAG